MSLAPGVRAISKRILDRFGTTATVVSDTTFGTYNTATRTQSNTATAAVVKGVYEEFRDSEINGTTIQYGDRKFIVPALGVSFKPTPGGRLTVGVNTMQIVRVEDFMIEGSAACYRLHLRGAATGT